MNTTSHTAAQPTAATAVPASPRAAALWRTGGLAAVAAALATTGIAAAARGAGVSLDIDGEPIPLLAFAQLTLACAVIGILLAVALRRWAGTPRRTFVVTTAALTVLSVVPDLLVPAAAPSTRAVLVLTHLAAAAIVVPLVAGRLPVRTR